MNFPQYRKLKNHPRYYRIDDERHFTELYFIGSKLIEHQVTATQYPEMLRIKDMLEDDTIYEAVTAAGYEDFAKK